MSEAKGRQRSGFRPSAWVDIPFGLLFANVTSSSLKLQKRSYGEAGEYPVIDQGEVKIGGYSDDDTLVHPGPLPVIIFGDHTRCVKYIDRPFIQGADGVKALAPSPHVVPRYSFWALKAADIPSRGYARHFSLLRKLSFPLPPVGEQHRIVEAIETQFTRLDAAVESLKRVQANLKRYRASVLKSAVEGRLVPTEAELARQEGRDYEPATVLLERILEERRCRWEEAELAKMKAKGKKPKDDKWKAKYKKPVEPDTSELPELPEGWCWATVNQLAVLVTDGDHNPPRRVSHGVPHLTAKNVKGWQLQLDGCTFITEEGFEQTRARYEPRPGDVIVTCVGTLGETALVPENLVFSADRNLAAIRLIPAGVSGRHLQLVLSSPRWRALMSQASGSTAQPHLYLRQLRQMPIPIPPVAEQSRIAEMAENLLSVVDVSQAQIEGDEVRCARLRQSILKWAFEGKLVDQDPDDEPAAELLERIQTDKAKATG